ncbi:MAG TPA: hypothetical protein VKY85_01180 [Candidatus Angelobacter sp.]|nr:hypothetical protein [Candidatus Angelobacter sp.]
MPDDFSGLLDQGTDQDTDSGGEELTTEISPQARMFLRRMANPDAMAAPLPGVGRRMMDASRVTPDASAQTANQGTQAGPPAAAAAPSQSGATPGLTRTNAAQQLTKMMSSGMGSVGQDRPPSHLSTVPASAPAPQMASGYKEAQEDLRNKSAVTPKIDPDTGKTADQYKIGVGGRIGRAFLDALKGVASGGIRGAATRAIGSVVGGAFGDKNSPGYYGKGAVNSQYYRDENERQREVAGDQAKVASAEDQYKQEQTAWKDQEESRKDDIRAAAGQDVNEARQQTNEARGETNSIRQQAQDLKEQLAGAPSFDQKSGKFMRGDMAVTPKSNDEGFTWEIANGITKYDPKGKLIQAGPYTRAAMAERKNQPINIHTGSGPKLTGAQRLKLDAYKKANKIANDEDLTPEQINAALATHSTDASDPNLTTNELANLRQSNPKWAAAENELKKLNEDRATYQAGTGSSNPALKKTATEGLAGLDQRIQQLQGAMDAMRQQVIQQRSRNQGTGNQGTASGGQGAGTSTQTAPAKSQIDRSKPSLPSITAGDGTVYKLGQQLQTGPNKGKWISYIDQNRKIELSSQPPKRPATGAR